VAKRSRKPHLLELARCGAEGQLNDLLHEARMILELFPDLKDSYDPDELPVKFLLRAGASPPGKRTLSKEARARISAAQKKRWAKRKSSTERGR